MAEEIREEDIPPPQHAGEISNDFPPSEIVEVPQLIDRVLEAAQIDNKKARSPQRWFGSEPRNSIEQWQNLDLTDEEIVETVLEVMAKKSDGPPGTLSYFSPAMQDRAGLKLRPALAPTTKGTQNDGKSPRERHAEDRLRLQLLWARNLDKTRAGGS